MFGESVRGVECELPTRFDSDFVRLTGLQFTSLDGDAGSVWVEDVKCVRARFDPFITSEQRMDQVRRQLLRANAVVNAGNVRCRTALPVELDGNRLDLFRDPGAVNAGENQGLVAAGRNGADFMLVMGEHDCFENGAVQVGDGHKSIVRHWSRCRPVLEALFQTQY